MIVKRKYCPHCQTLWRKTALGWTGHTEACPRHDCLDFPTTAKLPKSRKSAFERWTLKYIPGVGECMHFDGKPFNYGKLVIALNAARVMLPMGRK